MFLFVIPGEFSSVPLANPSPAITCLWVPRCACTCAYAHMCVCVWDGWSAGVYIGAFIPFQTRNSLCPPTCPASPPPPPLPPPSPTVNQMARQFGSSIKASGFYDYDYGYDDGSIYSNYLMKPLAKANRCRAGTISSPLKDPSNVATRSQISASKQKNGLFQRPLVTPCVQQYLNIDWEWSATTPSLWREADLWPFGRQKAVIAALTITLPWHLFKLSILMWLFSSLKRGNSQFETHGDMSRSWCGNDLVLNEGIWRRDYLINVGKLVGFSNNLDFFS